MNWVFVIRQTALGGLRSRSIAVARELLGQGHHVTLVWYNEGADLELSRRYAGRCETVVVPNISFEFIDPLSIWRACRFLAKRRANAVMCFCAKTPRFFPFLVAARLIGIRYVLVHHGTPLEPAPSGLGGRYFGGLLRGMHFTSRARRLLARITSRCVTHALFNNHEDQLSWVRAFRYPHADCRLWLPPVRIERFMETAIASVRERRASGLSDSCVFGTVGRLHSKKGFDDLIRAFALTRDSLPDARLMIVGDGPERNTLMNLARDLRVSSSVHFIGATENVAPFLADMDVFVSASRSESIGIAIVEAMASGVPVIVTDLPGPRRLVRDGQAGVIVPARDPTGLAAAMVKLIRDPASRRRLTCKGLERAAECNSRVVVSNLLQWLESA